MSAVQAQVRASQKIAAQRELTDLYIHRGKIGQTDLDNGCYTWGEVLSIVAAELWKLSEVDAARVTVKSGRLTVPQFLRQRFGIVTGAPVLASRKLDAGSGRLAGILIGVADWKGRLVAIPRPHQKRGSSTDEQQAAYGWTFGFTKIRFTSAVLTVV
ncbi:MAG: hypothetical protein ACKV2U_04990 [Bryobacteraceae bacterium]